MPFLLLRNNRPLSGPFRLMENNFLEHPRQIGLSSGENHDASHLIGIFGVLHDLYDLAYGHAKNLTGDFLGRNFAPRPTGFTSFIAQDLADFRTVSMKRDRSNR